MRLERGQRRPDTGEAAIRANACTQTELTLLVHKSTLTGKSLGPTYSVQTATRRQPPLGPSTRTRSACTTCWETCQSGPRIAGTSAIRVRRLTAARGYLAIARCAYRAVAHGSISREHEGGQPLSACWRRRQSQCRFSRGADARPSSLTVRGRASQCTGRRFAIHPYMRYFIPYENDPEHR